MKQLENHTSTENPNVGGDSLDFHVRLAGLDEIRIVINVRRSPRRAVLKTVIVTMDVLTRGHVLVHEQAYRTHGFSDDNLKFPLLLL